MLTPADNRWDYAMVGIFALLLAFMPFAYGAVEPWSELLVVAGGALLTAVFLLRVLLDESFRVRRTWLYVPIGLLLLLFVLQLAPLSKATVASLSPNTVATKAELLSDLDNPLETTALTFYPWETSHYLRLSLVAATVFVVAVSAFPNRHAILRLLTVVFLVGVAQALLALTQIVSLAKGIYWSVETKGGAVVTAGSFVNYSNFSQFINMSIGAGLALLLVRMHDRQQGRRSSGWDHVPGRPWWEDMRWLAAGLVVCAVSILTSMSRNGAMSMTVAAVVVGTLLFMRGSLSRRGWLLAVLPLGVLFVLLLTAFNEVYARLGTLQDSRYVGFRWEMFLAMIEAWKQFPVFGTGLGTHEYVFPLFDTATTPVIAERGDNDYAQLLEETGTVGTVLLAT
ncbi:MAG: O-antigen ligase family protein, partial [Planctomycetota bacterium]